MENLNSIIELLSNEGFIFAKGEMSIENYIEFIEKKAVDIILKNRVLTAGDESRIGFYIRAKALDEEISFFESGVAMMSIALSLKNQISGESSDIITENMRMKGCRTVGEFLFFTGPAGERIVRHSDLTGLFKAEFDKIWKKQSGYNPAKYTDKLKKNISTAIFS
ncbi:MAG TPA: hypothetical protein PKG52_01165 [bacterium]|nr:hypothetical protein [bacterium]HPS29408.1 hypothetical protein [bacterium]